MSGMYLSKPLPFAFATHTVNNVLMCMFLWMLICSMPSVVFEQSFTLLFRQLRASISSALNILMHCM